VSEKLRMEVLRRRANRVRQYQIARDANVHPSAMSAVLNSIIRVHPGDERVKRIGAAVGVPPEECFAE
jgi:hypothetical protein